MIVRLVIKIAYVKGKTEHDTPILEYSYRRSAPMIVDKLLDKYGDWMRKHQNWFIEPLVVSSNF